MPTIRKTVGQITLKVLTDVESTTYYYLLVSSMAPAPSKPTTNPPTGGWSTTEPEFFIYMPTQDTTIVPGKDYYIRSGTEGSYTYTKVLEPSIDNLNNYYEKIYGDTRSLYVTVQTLYTDNTFEYTQPSLSSSYEAAKEAYNRAKTALDLAGDINQYFWALSSAYSQTVPAGVYVTSISQSQFKSNPSQGNILIQNTGLTIRDGLNSLASLTGSALNFYNPTTHNVAMQLNGQALNLYDSINDKLTLSLNNVGLNFYGSSTSTPDASLTSMGLTLTKGGIKAGNDGEIGFIYLSSEDYPLREFELTSDVTIDEGKTYYIINNNKYIPVTQPTVEDIENYYEIKSTAQGLNINGHIPSQGATQANNDPAWREIIGTKFGVDSEGNLYANNAHLSGATVEGEITATSLTIGNGSNAYNGEAAINVSGYDIVIYEDSTDNSIIDHENTTYLYPVMYHNGEIDNTVDNTHYIWFMDNIEPGTTGDAAKGGIIASYGHSYRVTYDFDDSAVGTGTLVQERIVDPSKYITKISDTGITIHPEFNTNTTSIQLDGTGLDIIKNGVSVAKYSTTARIGQENGSRFLINTNSLQAYSGTDITPYFEVSANGLSWGNNTAATTAEVNVAAQTASNYIALGATGIMIYDGRNGIQSADNPSTTINNVFIDNDSLDIRKGTNVLATFGATEARIGNQSGGHLLAGSNGIAVKDGLTELAIFGVNGMRMGKEDGAHITLQGESLSGNSSEMQYFDISSNGGTYTCWVSLGSLIKSTGAKTVDLSSYSSDWDNMSVGDLLRANLTYVYQTEYGPWFNFEEIYFTKGTASTSSQYAIYDGANTLTITASYPAPPDTSDTYSETWVTLRRNEVINNTPLYRFGNEISNGGGAFSFLVGDHTISNENIQLIAGKYNAVATDVVFAIGNGSADNGRSNALVVNWNGKMTIAGTLTQSSDKRLKEHKAYLGDDAVEFINKLKPVYYLKDNEPHLGFYAQDIEKVDSWNCMVGEMNGYKTLGYTEIIAPLVAYCQHLEERIKQLEEK